MKPYLPCTDLVICFQFQHNIFDQEEWLIDLFTKLETNEVGSLSLVRQENKYPFFTLSEATFSIICDWIKLKGDKLKRVVIKGIKYVGQ